MAIQALNQATSEASEIRHELQPIVRSPEQPTAIPQIKIATMADEAAIIHAITLAFSADPLVRWAQPDSHQYLTYMPQIVRAFAGKAFAHRSAYYVNGYAGAALWLPPDVHPDEDELLRRIGICRLSVSIRSIRTGDTARRCWSMRYTSVIAIRH